MSRVLLLFVDGIGLGEDDPAINPFAAASLPIIESLIGGNRVVASAAPYSGPRALLRPLDATLGISGLPQSGTGQTALFTGQNAAQIFGRHFGPWVPTALRGMLAEQNILTRAKLNGGRVAFANAYPEEVFARSGRGRDPLRAAPPIAALGASVMNRHTPELQTGNAVASEITNDGWRQHLKRTELPIISAHDAGVNLARIASAHDVTLFAHYSTDHIGHTGEIPAGVAALERVDQFLGGLLDAAVADLTIVLASDHGNLEDVRVGHTTNPAIGLFIGPARDHFDDSKSLMDIAPRILQLANSQ